MSEWGSRVCVELINLSGLLNTATKSDLDALFLNYRLPLQSDQHGVAVLKAYKSVQ